MKMRKGQSHGNNKFMFHKTNNSERTLFMNIRIALLEDIWDDTKLRN